MKNFKRHLKLIEKIFSSIVLYLIMLILTSVFALADTGGIITTDGAYTIHTFLTNDTYVSTSAKNIEILMVGAGGSGGRESTTSSGGGGAGGLIYNASYPISATTYPIIIGFGAWNNSGENTSFNNLIALGGGKGSGPSNTGSAGNGGSGGGAGQQSLLNGNGTAPQGNNGGQGWSPEAYYSSAGGGGHNTSGSKSGPTNFARGGSGGLGSNFSISGTTKCYAGGGGGGTHEANTTSTRASGGCDNSGQGAVEGASLQATNATNGFGGGGGGNARSTFAGTTNGVGGSGVVIIRYLTSPSNIPSISFITPPTPTNNSIYYLKNESLTINASISSGNFNITLKLFNSTGTNIYTNTSNNVNSLQTNINTTSLSLSAGVYYFNATFNNATYSNISETRTFTIYNLIQNGFITPINNYNNTNGSLYISWNPSTTNPNVSASFTYNLSLYNTSGFIRTLNTTTTNNFFWNNIYNLNLTIGNYTLNLTSTDFNGNTVNQITNFNQQTNALLNITAKKALTLATINTFNVTLVNTSGSSNFKTTTSESILIDYAKGDNYNLTIRAALYASNSTSFTSTETYSSAQFLLWGSNSLLIRFYDELTQTLMINKTVFLELISDVYSNNYSTTNGSLSVELLDPETYQARYDSLGYVERFYEFTVTEDSAQFLNLYLLNETIADEITINILDQDTLALEGAVVKALKYDIATNTYITVEIATTNIDGEVVMDLTIGDEFYKFIVIYDGVIVKTTSPSYIYSNALTIQVTIGEDILNNYDQYKNIVTSLYFEGETTNTTVFFYNDLQNLNFEFCLKMYKVRNSSRFTEQNFIGEDCSTSSSDSLTYTLTNIREGDLYFATGNYYPDGQEQTLSSLYISFADDEINTGIEGLWLQIILTILIALFCIVIPEILPMGIVVSLIFGNLMKLNSLNIYMLFGLLFFAAMITYAIVQIRKS